MKSMVSVEVEPPVEEALRRVFGQMQRRDFRAAQEAVRRILVGHPDHLETRVLQAMMQEERGDRAEAAALWQEVERVLVYQGKLEPFILEETLEAAALHYFSLARPERGRIFLDELWRRFPTGEVTARAQMRAAEVDAAAQRWSQAIQRCNELVRIRGQHPAAERCRRLSLASRRMLELGPEASPGAPAWSWENPLPQGNTLHDVWVTGRGEVIAVGEGGTILRRPGGGRGFQVVVSPTRWSLRRLWGGDGDKLWAAGDAGLILEADGKDWRVARPARAEQPDLWGIYASGGQVVAVGEGGVVVSSEGRSWAVQQALQTALRAVWGDGRRLLAVGAGGTLLERGASGTWKTLASDCYEDLWSLAGAPSGPVLVVGSRRTVVRLDGEQAKESVVGRADFRDVWAVDGKEAWAVGTRGDIEHWSGGKWRSESSGTLLDLHGIGGGRGNELWAVGEGGIILRRSNGRWSAVTGGTHHDLVAVSAAGGTWALGERGLLFRRVNGRWSSEPPLPVGRYRDLWGDGQRQIAVGDRGLLVMRSGHGPWRAIPTDAVDDLASVCGFPGGAVAVGSGGTLLRLQGERVIRDSTPTGLDLRAVWASSPRQAIAVGNRGVILRFDGERWTVQESGTLNDLLAVWALPGGPALVAGAQGTLLVQENSRWRPQATPLQQDIIDLWGSSPRRIFAISDRGSIIHFDGAGWQVQRSPAGCLSGVEGDALGNVWAVGCRGAILALSAR